MNLVRSVQRFLRPGCLTGCFLQVAQRVAEKLMDGENRQLGRLLGRLEHPGCSLNVLKVRAVSVFLSVHGNCLHLSPPPRRSSTPPATPARACASTWGGASKRGLPFCSSHRAR